MPRLSGKVAVVTGAGSGIGRAAAILFAAEGAKVVAVDKTFEAVNETAVRIKAAKGTAAAFTADAGNEQDVETFIGKAIADFGGLDVVWANAGIGGGLVPLGEQTIENWNEVLRVNLLGPFLAIKHAMKHMVPKGRSSIVCTASIAGLRANAAGHPYSASKAGVISLVQTSAYSLAGTGVRVNAICPGLVETGMTKPLFDRARAAGNETQIGHLNPLKRAASPDEIATVGLFLASDDASYVNGQALPVDGGLTSSVPYRQQRV